MFVRAIPSSDTEGDAQYRRYEHFEKPSLERWATWSTFALAVFTFLLFLFTAFLWKVTLNLSKEAKRSSGLAESTAALNVELARGQIEELRVAHILQYRPRLRVRNIVIHEPLFKRNAPIRGQFYVSNIGGSRALVERSHCEVFWTPKGLPMERPYEGTVGNEPLPGKPVVAAGASTEGIFSSGDKVWTLFGAPDADVTSSSYTKLFVLGWIEYMDDLAIRHRTAFCRQLVHRDGSARFYPVDDPDYENEE